MTEFRFEMHVDGVRDGTFSLVQADSLASALQLVAASEWLDADDQRYESVIDHGHVKVVWPAANIEERYAPICKGCGEPIRRDWLPTDESLLDYHAGCRPGYGRIPYRFSPRERCCFRGCEQPVTHHVGNDVYYPMCDEHYALTA